MQTLKLQINFTEKGGAIGRLYDDRQNGWAINQTGLSLSELLENLWVCVSLSRYISPEDKDKIAQLLKH